MKRSKSKKQPSMSIVTSVKELLVGLEAMFPPGKGHNHTLQLGTYGDKGYELVLSIDQEILTEPHILLLDEDDLNGPIDSLLSGIRRSITEGV